MDETKPFQISKRTVMDAYERVRANQGAAGVDRQTLEDYAANLKDNLYKLWNRMSSGSYFPPPVRAVSIPKKAGGERVLGIPTVSDRIAQMVVKRELEPVLEPIFLADSYGYRPGKSAIDAVSRTRVRCWQHDWVLEFDIRGLFDNIPHDLLLKAVEHHTSNPWVVLYIKRWLRAPLQGGNGQLIERTRGTPQGGVISPLLANLFLHYVFDAWMQRNHPSLAWCRYADDGLVHCDTREQAERVREQLERRFSECGLELHPEKTKIVYCKDSSRTGTHEVTKFDFLGYTFRPRIASTKDRKRVFVSFSPAMSGSAGKTIRRKIRESNLRNRSNLSLDAIAQQYNPMLRGWIGYYGRFCPSEVRRAVFRHFNRTLAEWARNKYKRLRRSRKRAYEFLAGVYERQPDLFAHWRLGKWNALA